MTAQTKTVIKSYFETGDRPTEAQFIDLVDSYANSDLSDALAGYLDFDTAASSESSVGRMRWNDTDKCIEYDSHINGSVVTNQIGQEIWARVDNQTGETIDNGSAVYVNGTHGHRPTIALAQADDESTSLTFIGLTTEDIPSGDEGFVTIIGIVRDVNTATFSAGDILYVSETTPGALTATRPTSPNQAIAVGVCTVSGGNGEIAVRIRIQPNFERLSNVYIVSSADANLMQYNSSNSRWENRASLALAETSTPDAMSAGAVIYSEDDGAGKTRLMVRFPSGASQQLSIEP